MSKATRLFAGVLLALAASQSFASLSRPRDCEPYCGGQHQTASTTQA